jgi:hypothetical protein
MPMRKPVLFAVIAVGLAVLVFERCWPSRPQIAVKFARIEHGEIIDDTGAESWLVALTLTNLSGTSLYFSHDWITVETKIAEHWVETENRLHLSGLGPDGCSELALILPFASDGCRVHLRFASTSFEYRLIGQLERLHVRLPAAVYRWAYPPEGKRPSWRTVSLDVVLPRRLASSTRSDLRRHNEGSAADAGFSTSVLQDQWPGPADFFRYASRA